MLSPAFTCLIINLVLQYDCFTNFVLNLVFSEKIEMNAHFLKSAFFFEAKFLYIL